MALNQFPYTNFHELNGDYVLQTVQQASQDAAAAAQSAQAAAGQVAEANQKATEALARATIANTTASGADQKAETAITQAQAAQAAAQAAATDAQTAQAQVAGAQAAAQAAQSAASEAAQSAYEANRDAAEAIQTAEQALAAIPTADTLTWSPSPVNAYYIGTGAGNVGRALNIAYPKYIEFMQVGTTDQYQATVATPLDTMVDELYQGLYIDAIVYTGTLGVRLRLTDLRITAETIHMAWIGVVAGGGDAELMVLSMDCLRSASSNLTAVLTTYDLSPLEV